MHGELEVLTSKLRAHVRDEPDLQSSDPEPVLNMLREHSGVQLCGLC